MPKRETAPTTANINGSTDSTNVLCLTCFTSTDAWL